MKRRIFLILLAVGIVIPAWFAMALTEDEAKELHRDPLRGLQGVNVLVEPLNSEMKSAGITEEAIQTKVELRLRTSGIKVLSEKKCLETLGQPYLYVIITSVFQKDDAGQPIQCSFSLVMSLQENVYLQRDPSKKCCAAIWKQGSTGYLGIRRIDSIYDNILELVDTFCNDYLAANPTVVKTPTSTPTTQPAKPRVDEFGFEIPE